MVRVEVAFPVPGVMLLGEKEQLNVLGRPLHESAIGLLDIPDSMAAVTVTLPDLSSGTVTAVGDAVKEMVVGTGAGGGALETVFGHVGLYSTAPVI
jgi:hypothetical protein